MMSHHNNVPWDGIWLDMTEASSFCIGSCGSGNLSLNPVHPPFGLPGEEGSKIFTYPEGFNITNSTEAAQASSLSASQASAVAAATPPSTQTMPYLMTTPTPGERNINYPPYVINNINGELGGHAVSPNATHHNGVQEYDVHNLWGYQALNATNAALREIFPGKRPFIIGRSTFAGSGRSAGHWGGDNTSLFAYMYFSISQALNFAVSPAREEIYSSLIETYDTIADFSPALRHPHVRRVSQVRKKMLKYSSATELGVRVHWTHGSNPLEGRFLEIRPTSSDLLSPLK